MSFVSMDEVRRKFKKAGANFQKGYFEAYNNPNSISVLVPTMRKRIDALLTEGRLTKKTSDFHEGIMTGLKERGF